MAVVDEGSHPNPDVRLVEVPLPDVGPHQVLVEVTASGVCHSQLHQIDAPRSEPLLLGHEATGIVRGKGSRVRHVSVGESVVISWLPRTPGAKRVAAASTARLPDGRVAKSRNVFTWATHTLVDGQFVNPTPTGLDPIVASVLGCAVMTGAGAVVNTAAVRRSQSVAVIGVGGVGLSAIAAARHVGAAPIVAVDIDDAKLELSLALGATCTVNANREDPVQAVRRMTTSARGERTARVRPLLGLTSCSSASAEPRL